MSKRPPPGVELDWDEVRSAVSLAREEDVITLILKAGRLTTAAEGQDDARAILDAGKYFRAVQHGLRPLLQAARAGDKRARTEWLRACYLGKGGRPSRVSAVVRREAHAIVEANDAGESLIEIIVHEYDMDAEEMTTEYIVEQLNEHLQDPDVLGALGRRGDPLQLSLNPLCWNRAPSKAERRVVLQEFYRLTGVPGFADAGDRGPGERIRDLLRKR